MATLNFNAAIYGAEEREEAIRLVSSLAAALKIEVAFPAPLPEPGDLPG